MYGLRVRKSLSPFSFILDLNIPYITKRNTTSSLELNCSSDGNPQPSYQWTHFGEVVGNNSLLMLNDINETYIATYICHVKNVVGEYSAKINANEQCNAIILEYIICTYISNSNIAVPFQHMSL